MKIWVTSDLHLGHKNIIKYCHRPFKSLTDMNTTLIQNWNKYVSRHDHVYFLGDLAFAKHGVLGEWLRKLNGHITFIKGNHDVSDHVKFELAKFIKYEGINFFMVHDPKYVPIEWGGWVIHGHHHNNNLDKYPFINFENKTVNVSVDVTKYRPVDMDYIAKRIHRGY